MGSPEKHFVFITAVPFPYPMFYKSEFPIQLHLPFKVHPINLIMGIVHLWKFTFGSPLTLQAYTIGISKQKGIKIGYLNATYDAGQHKNKIVRRKKYGVSNMC